MENSTWKGYKKVNFTVGGRESYIVCPETPLEGNPWVWRTEFFGAFDTADMALLKAGWHLAYHQASNMYGCPKSIEYFSEFHNYVCENYGLAPKPVLFGFSRGGLYAVNYAAAYPERVSVLYLDAPVLDIKFWPCGMNGAYPHERDECLQWYSLTMETLPEFKGNPVDKADIIINSKIPVIIVAGDSDRVVPYVQNGKVFYDMLKSAGADVELILKPGVDHHPHSLEDPEPIVKFITSRYK